jgi:uncharacterized protein involved in cysteine biosynthesis
VNIGLLALHLLPLIGSIAAIFGSLYFNSMILGGKFIAYPLDLRGMRPMPSTLAQGEGVIHVSRSRWGYLPAAPAAAFS